MNSVHKTEETPKERLERIARYSLPRPREVAKRNYLVGVALLILILAMLAVALLGGSGAAEMMRVHAQQIKQFASQLWQ